MIIDLPIAVMEHGVQLTEADKVRPAIEEKGNKRVKGCDGKEEERVWAGMEVKKEE